MSSGQDSLGFLGHLIFEGVTYNHPKKVTVAELPGTCCLITQVPPNCMDVSENSGTPKSSILIGFSIINHPFWGTTYFWKHPCCLDTEVFNFST